MCTLNLNNVSQSTWKMFAHMVHFTSILAMSTRTISIRFIYNNLNTTSSAFTFFAALFLKEDIEQTKRANWMKQASKGINQYTHISCHNDCKTHSKTALHCKRSQQISAHYTVALIWNARTFGANEAH